MKMQSFNPSTGELVWEGQMANEKQIINAIQVGKKAQKAFVKMSYGDRKQILLNFANVVKENVEDIARAISSENGKPFWEAKTEANTLANKANAAISSFEEKMYSVKKELANGKLSFVRYKPHGLLIVLGPYNFPMSMANTHITSALLAGNSVIFKPSEKTPFCGEKYAELWKKAGLPDGVLQVIQGDGSVGQMLVENDEINGVLFVGSKKVGLSISKALSMKTDKICALEMGGNSPLMIWDYKNIRFAINIAIQSSFLSTGQRCSCARRLILNKKLKDEFITAFVKAIEGIVIGNPFDSENVPFMGPVIDEKTVNNVIQKYEEYIKRGAKPILQPKRLIDLGNCFVSPAIVDVTGIDIPDEEVFGPFLQVVCVDTFENGLEECNKTSFGLAAGLISESRELYDLFFDNVDAGIINWNQQLTGSSGQAPFGGIKLSGNHRPAGYFSSLYCSYAVASIESSNTNDVPKLSAGLKF